ncbi:hypothetical protein [Cellulomonas sp. C5510]|uniref:hypothetical protein n=1 Tax=Cellulomonas sp. C5510 TaxID=2871170 RepID=UPI001C950F61|nr:hypothetical protein [Cellulomonas sp. C5510]QZN85696.1 hypothetical protein K5O09_00145 [Cellulomonas sp. C5510]
MALFSSCGRDHPPAGLPAADGLDTGAPSGRTRTDVFGWDAANRLTVATVDGVGYAYSYFADGLRATALTDARQIAFAWGTPTTVPRLLTDEEHRYLYGPSSTPVAQIETSGTVQYVHTDLKSREVREPLALLRPDPGRRACSRTPRCSSTAGGKRGRSTSATCTAHLGAVLEVPHGAAPSVPDRPPGRVPPPRRPARVARSRLRARSARCRSVFRP